MKYILSIAALCFYIVATGCGSWAMMSDTLVTNKVSAADSVYFTELSHAYVSIDCEYPVSGNPILVDSINTWILKRIKDNSKSNDIPTIVTEEVSRLIAEDSAEIVMMINDPELEIEYYSLDYDSDIEKVYEDDDYVTFCHTLYLYMAGAHGSTNFDYATFYKSGANAGKIAGWDLVANYSPAQLQNVLVTQLGEYFNTDDKDELFTELMVDDAYKVEKKVPLPQSPPYLTKDGVSFIYQEYEILPYASGSPEFVVGPLKK